MIKTPVACDYLVRRQPQDYPLVPSRISYLPVLDGNGIELLRVVARKEDTEETFKDRARQIVFALNYHFAVTEEDDPIHVRIAD